MPEFSSTSLIRLGTCERDLQALFLCVVRERDCIILCGHRGEADQNKAFDEGKSKLRWPHGNHNKMPSRAVDVAPYPLDWDDKEAFVELSKVVKRHAKKMGIKVGWGGDWQGGFIDLPHWELV